MTVLLKLSRIPIEHCAKVSIELWMNPRSVAENIQNVKNMRLVSCIKKTGKNVLRRQAIDDECHVTVVLVVYECAHIFDETRRWNNNGLKSKLVKSFRTTCPL